MSWLNKVESGRAVSFGEDGNANTLRDITPPQQPAPAK
jgi:hypothetical protein